METIKFSEKSYNIEFSDSGKVLFLSDNKKADAPWNAISDTHAFGVPFINGTQESENAVECALISKTDNEVLFESASGVTKMLWKMDDEKLTLNYKCYPYCGPRMGVMLDVNLLDLETGSPWQEQCMPTTIYTDPERKYAYFIFTTSSGRYMTLCVKSEFAAWRIKYSYEGHRMTGFQILSEADDVRCDGEKPLSVVDSVDMAFTFPNTVDEAFEQIAEILGICIAMPQAAGGFAGATVPYKFYGEAKEKFVTAPDGGKKCACGKLSLTEEGEYKIETVSKNGRAHSSSVLCQKEWEKLFDSVNGFYKTYFQHECGAFARVIWKDTLSYKDSITFEGVEFGNPEIRASCRTGEFGGFAAWAMMKNCMMFGEKPELMESIDRYINNWAMNRGNEHNTYVGTVSDKPVEFQGRSYSAYHLYNETNYPQHEIFLLEELADYYRITGDKQTAEDVKNLVLHFINDHIGENGCAYCENVPGDIVDYCTVHVTLSGLLNAWKVMQSEQMPKADTVREACMKLADYVCARGLGFPTEGEQCTEDGSMACTAITLLMAYTELEPKQEYFDTAKEIIEAHKMLEMISADCRMNGSSIRFWETQYESRDWGPSINAGHAWSIWIAEAKVRMAVITGDFELLRQAYNGFITNFRKIEENGAMPSCYTPDMIPGTPHAHGAFGNVNRRPGPYLDMRPTTSKLAMKYVPKTYATSGNYSLIKAGEFFSHISGFDKNGEICVNGIFEDGVFKSKAVKFDTLVLAPFEGTLKIKADSAVTIVCGEKVFTAEPVNGVIEVTVEA